jgi:hypothetical protein
MINEKKKKKDDYRFPELTKNWSPDQVINSPKAKFLKWNPKSVPDTKIRNMCNTGVIEVKFKRRIWPIKNPRQGQKSPIRRMLATAAFSWVSSNKDITQWVPPKGIRPRTTAWYKERKLIIIWDMILRKFRMISLDDYQVLSFYSLKTKKHQKKFKSEYEKMINHYGYDKLEKWFNK